jgi:hypothetical protein
MVGPGLPEDPHVVGETALQVAELVARGHWTKHLRLYPVTRGPGYRTPGLCKSSHVDDDVTIHLKKIFFHGSRHFKARERKQ